ncbi:MAG TPA: hypothetical protein VNM37_23160, partial [Candidatus Dormibacteraeota bacterium]|nr:hypothetical protein [Candidatus Dormibacteraeota bacterium]
VDPNIVFNADLQKSGDGKLRVTDFATLSPENLVLSVTSPGAHDISLTARAKAKVIVPDAESIDLGNADLTFSWANINNASSVSVTASVGIGQDIINFLRFGAENVLDQLKALKEDLNTLRASAGLTINGQRSSAFSIAGNLGFANDALDKLLDFVNAFDQKVIQPLTHPLTFQAGFGSAQDLAVRLAHSMGVDPADSGFALSDGALTYHLHFVQPVSVATVTGSVTLDATFGVALSTLVSGSLADAFFVKDVTVSASGTFSLPNSQVNLGPFQLYPGPGTTASLTFSLSLADPDHDPQNRIQLSELKLSNLSSLIGNLGVDVTITGTVGLSLGGV